ncbi:hypothetical protein K461DRAFT_250310 [Myriangium duriaei CBS 260.36]|uniref:Vacuolar protein sorting-associated protein 62 n=1 Tax=Myriangium duriaei CBS 260.36 TaxID=1168546 RepID=A0A9P4MLI8_9PEZI|nr:hypothetical protein K461DRAFT_250310 [Myriangium duriaei CBS 260.36]
MVTARVISAFLAFWPAVVVTTPIQKRAVPSNVPQFVVQYAPLVWLHPEEVYLPSDIGSQLVHTVPEINFQAVATAAKPLTLDNVNTLNTPNGSAVYLTSKDDISKNPAWLNGVRPDATGSTGSAISCAIITVNKGNGIVDAFYMYFYAYNWGGKLLGIEVGDHVGDWEHNAIRFLNGVPQSVWYSQHSDGQAFTWSAVQKQGNRVIGYSANGTHANYATAGTKDRVIPGLNIGNNGKILNDYAGAGTLWDPTLAAYYACYENNTKTFSPYDTTTPTNWLSFIGQWGDQQYPDSDPRQDDVLNLHLAYKYEGGPTGPEDKNLGRTNICLQDSKPCKPMSNLLEARDE